MAHIPVERRLGLTPAFKRVAYHYLTRGRGTYKVQHPHYDRIVVKDLYEFSENPILAGEYAGGMTVAFYRESLRVKWVEFRCQVVGGGGEAIVKEV